MKKLKEKNLNQGITLVALVITIIILLILAGITISQLNDNGLFEKVKLAKEKNDEAKELEDSILSEYENQIGRYTGNQDNEDPDEPQAKTDAEIIAEIQTTATKPYLPTGFSISEESKEDEENKETTGGALARGLVITDGTNEYVWVEVPKTGGPNYTSVSGKTDYENIRTALQNYATSYRATNYEDYWYYQPTSGSSPVYSKDPLTGTQYKDNSQNSDNISTYLTSTDGTKGTGLTYEQYETKYKAMLSSVYENGGFYIGRYEAGIAGSSTETSEANGSTSSYARTEHVAITNSSPNPVSKQNSIPYNHISCSEAESLAERISVTGRTSSLLFGIQWDLTLKYLETKLGANVTNANNKNILTQDSSEWGNYYNAQFTINRGRYAKVGVYETWYPYTSEQEGFVTIANNITTKPTLTSNSNSILLTTGASDQNCKQNIYDLAGNLWELTLERTSETKWPCELRGGYFCYIGSGTPSSFRGTWDPVISNALTSFRLSLY